MQENKNLVQEALLQMKNVEEAIAQNAKGILASTMKEEINQLVKESLSEQDDEDEVDLDVEMGDESPDSDDIDTDNEEEVDMKFDMPTDSDETPIDLTDASDEEILKVFKAMGEEDGIIVKKDGDDIHLTDNDSDTEYLVKLGESEEDKNLEEMEKMNDKINTQDVIDAIFRNDQDEEEVMFEIDFEDETDLEEGEHNLEEDETDLEEGEHNLEEDETDLEEVMYEIEFDDEEEFTSDMMEDDDENSDDELGEMWGGKKGDESKSRKDYMGEDDSNIEEDDDKLEETYNHKKAHKVRKSETKEGKMSMKPKGMGMGSPSKFKYPKNVNDDGFDEKKKPGQKTMGTGKAKFTYKKGENMNGKSKVIKKAETKEAARTLGMGSDFREGGLPKPRAHSEFNINIDVKESLQNEVVMLREKNEEYRKALNVFREKLNEVAIFNSNLAYATRLFTEHSTTKKEKINILRRFDDVDTLKESKSLYKSIKDELGKTESKSINESVEKKINNTVSSGSATNLIESKTYENPQFLRMKDLMSKLG